MMKFTFLKRIFLFLFCMGAPSFAGFNFGAGLSLGNEIPIALEASLHYNAFNLRLSGMGVHEDTNDFWCGFRGALGYTFLNHLPYKLSVHVSSGYAYSRAPNKLFQAINEANQERFLYPYNFHEALDFSIGVRTQIYGFYTQVDYPIHYFTAHKAPKIFWRIGYSFTAF